MTYRFYLNIEGEETLIEEPVGWASSELTISRDMERYHGLFFGYTTELEFIGDGYRLLSEQFALRGFEGQAILSIQMDCNGGGYEEVFVGELNFATYNAVNSDLCQCTIEVTSSSLEVKVVNRQEVLVSMQETEALDGGDISGNTLLDLTMHNYTILYQGRWDSNEQKTNSKTDNLVGANNYFWQFPNPICIAFNEIGGMTDCTPDGQMYVSGSVAAVDLFNLSTLFVAPRTSTYTITFKLSGIFRDVSDPLPRQGNYLLTFDRNNSGIIVAINEPISSTFYSTSLNEYSVSFDTQGTFTFSMAAGDRVAFRWINNNYQPLSGGTPYTITQSVRYDADNFITIGEESTYPATVSKATKLYDAFWKAVSYYTGSKDLFYSLYLGYQDAPDREYVGNGCASYTAIANGYALRGFPISEKPIMVNLRDLFDSADAIFNIGLGFEAQNDGTVRCRVEQKSYFYSNQTLLAIFDDVKEIRVLVEENLCYNIFELGFADYKVEQGTEKLNTNNEFASKYSWKTVAKNVKNTFSRVSKYIGSLYPIEYTRRNRYIDAGTKESKFDQDNFIIAMNRSGLSSCEKAENFDSVTGIDSPTEAYNLRFNLFSTLLRWSNIFNSSVSRLFDKALKFQYGALNTSLQLEYTSAESCEGNYENEPFVVSQDLEFFDENNTEGLPLYEPVVYEFEYPLSWYEYNTFKAYPQGTIIFGRDSDSLIQAFLLEVKYKPNQGLANFRLLRSYEQNIDLFFPPIIDINDLPMGFILEFSGSLSIFDSTGRGTGIYRRYALCNGQNGTPDLRGQFTVGYSDIDSDYNALGNTGGVKTNTLTTDQLPSHSHTLAGGSRTLQQWNQGAGAKSLGDPAAGSSYRFDGITATDNAGGGESVENRPPYYVLAKVMIIE